MTTDPDGEKFVRIGTAIIGGFFLGVIGMLCIWLLWKLGGLLF